VPKRILVVDDDEHVRNLEQAILERPGYEVASAGSGQETLDRLAAGETYDLIILDVMMPEMDGFEVCRRIKADPRHADQPVIFLTAKGGGGALVEGLEAGGMMYIRKPFTATKLLAVVETMLEAAARG